MAYILDGAAILVVLLAVFIGYRRGFVRSLIQLVGLVAAVIVAAALSTGIASLIFDQFVSEGLTQTVASKIQTTDTAAAAQSVQQALEELPGPVYNALVQYVGTPEEIVSGIQGSLEGGAETVASTVVRLVIRPVAVALLRFLVFFILFILLMIVVGLVARLVNGFFKAPVLKQINGTLGAVIGLVQGILFLFVAVTVVQMAAASASADAVLSSDDVDNAILVGFIAEHNPITGALESAMKSLPEVLVSK